MHNWLLVLAVTANPADATFQLLKTFRGEFIKISPGEDNYPASFDMGSNREGELAEPMHRVTFSYSFQVAKYEVPQNLWQAVMGENPSRWKGERNSVEMLSHADAVAFCEKATVLMRRAKLIEADQVIRLPSESEWEYCARAGTKTAYSFGDPANEIDAYAWHTGNAAGNDPPVGAKKPNPWGLYDVHGYLWEWCADVAAIDYQQAPVDGAARQGKSDKRVLRGGSWKDPAAKLTSSYRRIAAAELRDSAVGLRCVLAKQRKN